MENFNKNSLIDIAIKGFFLFFGLVVFLFFVLGEKADNNEYVYEFYNSNYGDNFLFTFIFSYAEILALFYLRDKNIKNKATHIISIIYAFVVAFVLYLNIVKDWSYDDYYLKFSAFIFLFFTIEIILFILTYKEDELRKMFSNKKRTDKFSDNKKNDINNENIADEANANAQNTLTNTNSDTVRITYERKNMFSNPFSFYGRIRRLEYIFSFLFLLIILISFAFITNSLEDSSNQSLLGAIFFIFMVPTCWFIIAQGVKRSHDLGKPGWWQLIPFWGLFMLFEDGEIRNNEYGAYPKKQIKRNMMFSHPFSFNGRIRRLEYGISCIIYMPAGLLITESSYIPPFLGLLLIPAGWFIIAQGAKRCHDMGNSGFWQLVPLWIIFMLFEDSEIGTNQYGLDPKSK